MFKDASARPLGGKCDGDKLSSHNAQIGNGSECENGVDGEERSNEFVSFLKFM